MHVSICSPPAVLAASLMQTKALRCIVAMSWLIRQARLHLQHCHSSFNQVVSHLHSLHSLGEYNGIHGHRHCHHGSSCLHLKPRLRDTAPCFIALSILIIARSALVGMASLLDTGTGSKVLLAGAPSTGSIASAEKMPMRTQKNQLIAKQ